MAFLYSDVNHANPSEKPLVVDVEAIQQSIEVIFATMAPQRFFRNTYPGPGLDGFLFTEVSRDRELSVFRRAIGLVENNEPRVLLNKALSKVIAEPELRRYKIVLVYEIIGMQGQTFRQVGFLEQ